MHRHLSAARSATLEAAPAWHAAGRADVVAGADDLTLVACIVPWGQAGRVTDDGRTFYTESWEPGSLVPDDRVVIYDGHIPAGDGPGRLNASRVPIGRADGFETRTDGLYAVLRLANTARGRDVYELARTLGYVDVSLETTVPDLGGRDVVRTAADPLGLTGVAVVLPPGRGAFAGALAAARSDASTGDDDDDQTDDDQTDGDDDDATGAAGGRAAIAEVVRRELVRFGGTGRRPAARVAHPLARFNSFDAFQQAAREARDERAAELSAAFTGSYRTWQELGQLAEAGAVGRALVDQITGDNPGVMPPTWLTEVFGIVDRGRPGITALGGPRSPGSAGLDVYWPYYDGDLAAIVAEQLAQKTAINSVKVSFKRGQATLDTYAGGSDIAYQLIRRSSPSYRGLYDRVLQIAFGLTTEYAFDVAIQAGAGSDMTYDPAADTDGSVLRATLFAASAEVRNITGEPASVVLCASDVWSAIGGMAWLQPAVYGTQNVPGTAQASTLRVNISGLEFTEAPGLPDGHMIVTNAGAAAWFEDGPFIVTAEDVEKLGQNVAIWGMGTPGLFLPGGIVDVTVTVPPVIPLTRRTPVDAGDTERATRSSKAAAK